MQALQKPHRLLMELLDVSDLLKNVTKFLVQEEDLLLEHFILT